MQQEDFSLLINNMMRINEQSYELYSNYKINLYEYENQYREIIDILLKNVFTEEGVEWVLWYIYERISTTGNINEAFETNEEGHKERICYNVSSLYDYLVRKKYFKVK